MLQLYNLDKVKIRGLKLYKDYCIESELSSGDKTLSFLYPQRLCKEIIEESYIRTKKDEFVVKSVNGSGEWKSIIATLNVEDLEGKVFESFETSNKTINESLNLALAGTGWTVGTCDVTRRRTVMKTNSSSWEIIQEAKKIYRVEFEFDTLNKRINIFEKRGSDKGVYFIDTLNLKDVDIQGNSYEFYTRILAIGKDDIRVTLENFQYSKKVKTFIWKDERYTDIDSLREDAEAKLNEISKPYRAYSADVIDLASMKEEYKILNYELGDTITIASKDKDIKEKQRIAKMIEYPDEPFRNTCEIANITLKFEDIQKEFQDVADTVDNITTDNGTISDSAIESIEFKKIKNVSIGTANIQDASITTAKIGKAQITEAEIATATIDKANIKKAIIDELETASLTAKTAEIEVAQINSLLAGTVSAELGHLIHLTAGNFVASNAVIKNAMIDNLDVSKVNAGDISTNKFRITSASGNMLIADNTIQIRDNARVRVQIGKDVANDYNMYVWDATGKLMFDAAGLKADGIKNKIIRDDMISDTANISGGKINISSLVTSINNGATTINSSRVQLDGTNQTLNVAFNSLKTEVQGIEIGGRNLIRDTKREILIGETQVGSFTDDIKKLRNRYVTISVYVEVENAQEILSKRLGCEISIKYADSTIEYVGAWRTIKTGENFKGRIFSTYKLKDLDVMEITRKGMYIQCGGAVTKVSNIKFEYGNKNTDYAEAPEDVDGAIANVKQITESNSTTIGVMQGQISIAINNTQIIKDGQTILLKDDYNRTVQTVNSSSETIGRHESTINANTGAITNVTTDVTEVKKSLTGITQRVGTSEINITTVTTNANKGIEDARLAKLQADKGVADALAASNKAIAAQTTATNASTAATTANTNLADIASDSKITASEKLLAKKEWDVISGEKTKIESEAAKFGVSATTLISTYNVLASYLSPLFANLNATSDIVGATFRSNFTNYYNARQDLLNAITSKAKVLADTAQTQANLGVTNASTAQTQANKGVNDALLAFNKAGQSLIDAKNYTNAEITTVTTKVNSANSDITQLKNQIALKVEATDITTAITNIVVGGRNLVQFSLLKRPFTGFTNISNQSILSHTVKLDTVAEGDTLTVSFDFKYSGLTKTGSYGMRLQGSGNVVGWNTGAFSGVDLKDKINWETGTGYFSVNYSFTLSKQQATNNYFTTNIRCDFINGGTVELIKYKIEKGNKATDWTPAPEDVDQAILDTITITETKINQAKAEIKLETDRINLEVGKTNSVVTSHTTSINAVDGKINTAKGDAITEAVGVKDRRSNNDNPQYYFTNYPKRTVEEFKFANILAIPGYGAIYGVCTTVVPWNDTSGGYPIQTFRSNNTPTFERKATSATVWGSWVQVEDTTGSQAKANTAQTNSYNYTVSQVSEAKSSIKLETDSITQSVGAVNSKVTTINGTITSMETRLKAAEVKITDSSIISTVQATINTAKQAAIDSANSTTTNKLLGYSTTTQMNSAITQSAAGITSKVTALEGTVATVDGKVTAQNTRLTSAEQNITPTAIINSISSTINAGTGAITTTNTVLNKQGLTINNGALIVKNANGSTIIDGSKYIQYVEMYGNGAIVIQNGAVDAILTIRHGKGYVPDFKGEWMDIGARVYSDPFTLYSYGTNNGFHGIELTGKMWADSTYLYIWMRRIPSQATSGTQTMYYRYFILGGISY